jgi:FKBP-type peptidyl-prolyl cis-trans isomerase SlyD
VLEISDESVKMDFNHPLAGEDLYFSGKVVEVREASEEEINKMLHGGCGCGSGGCGSGCDDNSCSTDDSGCGCGSGCGC